MLRSVSGAFCHQPSSLSSAGKKKITNARYAYVVAGVDRSQLDHPVSDVLEMYNLTEHTNVSSLPSRYRGKKGMGGGGRGGREEDKQLLSPPAS